jgi:Domain of unknown function (DUF4157)
MPARVIQGFFPAGRPRLAPPPSAPPPAPPLAPPAARPTPAAPRVGPPRAPAPRPPLAERHGGNGGTESFPLDPARLGLAGGLAGGGRPLPEPVRRGMEAAFATDFSAVRVHVGPQAERIGALAFTTGSDIYFAPGRYQPDTHVGRQLLGHELAHVVQQRQGRVRAPGGSGAVIVHDPALEAEAERRGREALSRGAAGPFPETRVAQRAQPGNLPRPATRVAQLQKPNGLYQVSKPANLRNDNATHSVIGKLPTGFPVKIVSKGRRVSNFKAGWVTNEHSWVLIESKQDELLDQRGWIEDGKLVPAARTLQSNFQRGDKLYGLTEEARYSVLRGNDPGNQRIASLPHPTIDTINLDIIHGEELDEEATSFRDYVHQDLRKRNLSLSGIDKQIHAFCKYALIHYTTRNHTIHFMLDGIDPQTVVSQAKGLTTEHRNCTGKELRALLRAAMDRDSRMKEIDLRHVKFYLNDVQVKAPWAADADSQWGRAWKEYVKFKKTGTRPDLTAWPETSWPGV